MLHFLFVILICWKKMKRNEDSVVKFWQCQFNSSLFVQTFFIWVTGQKTKKVRLEFLYVDGFFSNNKSILYRREIEFYLFMVQNFYYICAFFITQKKFICMMFPDYYQDTKKWQKN